MMLSNQCKADDNDDAIARVDWSRADQVLDYIEHSCGSSRQIALLRIRLLSLSTTATTTTSLPSDLASWLVPVLSNVVSDFGRPRAVVVTESLTVAHFLVRVLKLVLCLVQQDPTLAEEFGRQGAHVYLLKLMNGAPQLELSREISAADDHENEAYDDVVQEIQELAGEIAVASRPYFPMAHQPFAVTDLKARLPLVFAIPDRDSRDQESTKSDSASNSILVRQVTTRQSAQDDVGFGQ
jgi:hypothetical protein